MIRNNVGVDSIQFAADVRTDGDDVVLTRTGQRFALDGPPPGSDGWQAFTVVGIDDEETPIRLRWNPNGLPPPISGASGDG
ncbi:MAG: hypothetical protein KDB80_09960 [Planctomycetes bacterium]|nr:hypothetical protein [Planctomycetota bacterium]